MTKKPVHVQYRHVFFLNVCNPWLVDSGYGIVDIEGHLCLYMLTILPTHQSHRNTHPRGDNCSRAEFSFGQMEVEDRNAGCPKSGNWQEPESQKSLRTAGSPSRSRASALGGLVWKSVLADEVRMGSSRPG